MGLCLAVTGLLYALAGNVPGYGPVEGFSEHNQRTHTHSSQQKKIRLRRLNSSVDGRLYGC